MGMVRLRIDAARELLLCRRQPASTNNLIDCGVISAPWRNFDRVKSFVACRNVETISHCYPELIRLYGVQMGLQANHIQNWYVLILAFSSRRILSVHKDIFSSEYSCTGAVELSACTLATLTAVGSSFDADMISYHRVHILRELALAVVMLAHPHHLMRIRDLIWSIQFPFLF
jgi:hypothetical protein